MEHSFQEIINLMADAETYEDLYNAIAFIADGKLQNDVLHAIQQCESDGDEVEEAYSIVCSDILDAYIFEDNVEGLIESVNRISEYKEAGELTVSEQLYNALKERYQYGDMLEEFRNDILIIMRNTQPIMNAVYNTRQKPHTAPFMSLREFCRQQVDRNVTTSQIDSALKKLGIDYKELLKPLVDEVIEDREENKDLEEDYTPVEAGYDMESVLDKITDEVAHNCAMLSDLLHNGNNKEELDGYYFTKKAIQIVKDVGSQYHINGYEDLSISEVLELIMEEIEPERVIERLYKKYKPSVAYSMSMSFIDILDKVNFDIVDASDFEYQPENYNMDESKEINNEDECETVICDICEQEINKEDAKYVDKNDPHSTVMCKQCAKESGLLDLEEAIEPNEEEKDMFDKLLDLVDTKYSPEMLNVSLNEVAGTKDVEYISQDLIYELFRANSTKVDNNNEEMLDGSYIVSDIMDINDKYVYDEDFIYRTIITIDGQDYWLMYKLTDYNDCVIELYDVVPE